MISNDLKMLLNLLQYHVNPNWKGKLFIFDNEVEIIKYRNTVKKFINKGYIEKEYMDDIYLVTISRLMNDNYLIGRRFNHYCFMTGNEMPISDLCFRSF